ncbi:MAG: ATP-dependent helicase HrpB [Bryobacteraceae bacterium]|nr:ATP-dependent helicase HrpB [Bryobacteraceae bacterium]
MTAPLPVDALLPEILSALRRGNSLVIEAPPGAGKTTRVPPALLTFGPVIVLEPRRLAARMAARRVAAERGEQPGETVGYQVRFEEVAGPRTRLRFLTEGVLTRRLLSDQELQGIAVVVLDEFHERHLDTDVALALLRRLQQTARPDLKLVVMSATLEAGPVAAFLNAPVIRSEGRLFDLSMEYTPHSAAPLETQVAQAVRRLGKLDGDVLVFLPGAAEIRACMRTVQAGGAMLVPLHGDLSPAEQDQAISAADRPKVILSTNIAESSVTIEGVTSVIDSGLARMVKDSPWTGISSLEVTRISKASAAQRAGRAGRLRPGRVIRLYSAEDFHRRPAQDPPEILRRELSQTLLDLSVMGVREPEFLDNPDAAAWNAAGQLLGRLGALDSSGAVTGVGRRMARLPLHPRLARIVVEAEARGVARTGAAIAAVLSAGERLRDIPREHAPSDLMVLAESDWQPNTRRIYDQLLRLISPRQTERRDEPVLISILTGFPDRVARRSRQNEVLLSSGGSARLAAESAVGAHEFLVAVDVEERRDRDLPLIRVASAVEPGWLLDLYPERIEERERVEWNRTAERVEASSAMLYDGLAIDESRGHRPDPALAAELLARKAMEAGIGRFVDSAALAQLQARAAFAGIAFPNLEALVREAAVASLGFRDLEQAGLLDQIRARLPKLDELAPERYRLPGGRSARIRYAEGQTPWIESRLQDFFGMKETPKVNGVPLVVHLLAPNQRPVQMTTDLAGFWQRLYPQVRKELMRRYPRHAWPEKPA